METNLFERKEFLNQPWISTNSINMFTKSEINQKTIVHINLLRATANETESFKDFLKVLLDNSNNNLIFDLSSCTFIDSTFLSTIITFNKNYKSKVEIVVKDIRQLTIFRITKLDKIFDIYSNLDSATAA
ncbi:MAG: STAS domain-containing protein [Ignavibacteriae bacterium]|nr:STAS domain-containing protein [Ignavibacteriota bacterium]